MHKPKDVPRTTQQWASIICSISNLTPHWLYSSRFIASHRSLLSSHTQRITISIRNYMCDNPNRLPSIITKNGIPTACFSNPPKKRTSVPPDSVSKRRGGTLKDCHRGVWYYSWWWGIDCCCTDCLGYMSSWVCLSFFWGWAAAIVTKSLGTMRFVWPIFHGFPWAFHTKKHHEIQ